jgi:opacity protein-like surface antigen
MKSILAISVLGLSLFASPAFSAPTSGLYAGLSVGDSSISEDSAEFDIDDTNIIAYLGSQLNQYFAAEVGYTSIGNVLADSDVNISADLDGIEASVLGFIPVSSNVSFFGRLGFWDWEVDAPGDNISGTDIFYGGGVEYNPTQRVQMRLEARKYEADGADVTMVNGSVGYRFH